MQKSCKQCSVQFEITQDDLAFYDKVSPVFNGVKYQIPEPSLCPNCRQQRRLTFRNERKFYPRKSDLGGGQIISTYSEDKPFPVYGQEEWWSDDWDPLSYGRDFDFSRPFFEQFQELKNQVPHPYLVNMHSENSQYTNHAAYNKNCYLCVNTGYSEDCLYCSSYCLRNKNCVDCLAIKDCELCYSCVDSNQCFHSHFLLECNNCQDSLFCFDCQNCEHCYGCSNLRNKKYCFFNQQLKKEEYFQAVNRIQLNSKTHLEKEQQKYSQMIQGALHKSSKKVQCENCQGHYLDSCKNTFQSFFVFKSEDTSYSYDAGEMKSSQDVTEPFQGELQYETHACNGGYLMLFTSKCYYCQNVFNSEYCWHSNNLFACLGLKHNQYCILNKQYTKEEYEELVPKIIEHMKNTGEWGEFFPVELSPFAYNETVAQEYFPLTKESALEKGWRWKKETDEIPNVTKKIPAERLPDVITEIPDDILNWAIICERSKRPFKIIPQELKFYREQGLPVPHLHPDERHKDRMALRNPRKLWTRKCDKCAKEIETTYAPKRPEKVYCEECYLAEVY